MATSSEIEAALVERVNDILAERHVGSPRAENHEVLALIQALAELMGDDEEEDAEARGVPCSSSVD